ncbi:MAG: hypothetical protein HOP23_02985 [Methylococcaceae bacterium]|nr:hypothetical protein [Methylococcaceae bacterium]
MKTNNIKLLKLATAGVLTVGAFAAFLAPTTASAALVGGTATITIDNTAFTASNAFGEYVETFWDASYNTTNITGATTGGLTLPTTGSTAMAFTVNTNTVTNTVAPSNPLSTPPTYGRTEQATTMDAGNTSVGQIGLSGAWRINGPGGVLTPYDFRLVKTGSTWNISTFDSSFSYQNFLTLANVSESLNGNGELLLSGDLKWTGLWASLAGASTSAVVGTFNLAPSAVPVPAAVWLFGSALMGFLGLQKRKMAA